jgi:flagellar L-ring protein FlgH
VRALWAVPVLVLLVTGTASAESLWSPGFRGYLSGGQALAKGDTVLVSVDASSALSFSASSNDTKNLTLEFSGGEAGNIFSFLPQVKSGGSRSAKGTESLRLQGEVAAVVTSVDASGRGMLQGTRSIMIEGKEESISVSGWLQPRDLDQRGAVSFSRLGEGKLVFRTFVQPAADVLTDKDIRQIVAAAAPAAQPSAGGGQPATAAAGTSQPPSVRAQPAAGAGQPAAPSGQTLGITEERKKELLLLYLNRLVDVLFTR